MNLRQFCYAMFTCQCQSIGYWFSIYTAQWQRCMPCGYTCRGGSNLALLLMETVHTDYFHGRTKLNSCNSKSQWLFIKIFVTLNVVYFVHSMWSVPSNWFTNAKLPFICSCLLHSLDRDGKVYQEGHCMSGHENFISAICILPPSEKYQQGLIVTGSNDHKINAYTLESPMPVFTLTGHENTGWLIW